MILGVVLFIIGSAIRLLSIKTLAENWSNVIVVPTKICQDGIYKYIRHPSYTGSIIALAGLFLINSLSGFLYLAFVFYYSRIVVEERLMQSIDYTKYKKQAGMLLPKIRKER